MKAFASTHKLPFETAPWLGDPSMKGILSIVHIGFVRFRVGTCDGLWRCTKTHYEILAITNSTPGNGHFQDVLEWFINSCKRDRKKLAVLEIWNQSLELHLVKKRGFHFIPGGVEITVKEWRKKNK